MNPESGISDFRDEFPYLRSGLVHLNHAGVSPLPARTAQAMCRFVNMASENPPDAMRFGWGRIGACRARLADLMGVPAEDLALTKNTAHGLSIVADGLDWCEGDEVVFADCEYPANTYAWLAQQTRGVVARVVAAREDGTVPPEDYARLVTTRTRVIAVSWVQFSTGYRSDLAALARIAHDAGALLVVDVIQGLGVLPINLTALGADIAATGSQKWLLGPLGVGGLSIHPTALSHLRLVNMGSGSVKNVRAFNALDLDPKPNAQRYEEGTPNLTGLIGLEASLSLIQEAGIENVGQQILAITGYAAEALKRKAYTILSPEDDEQRAGILIFKHPALGSDEIVATLDSAGVVAAPRGAGVRFAPHFYLTEEDMDRAIAALP